MTDTERLQLDLLQALQQLAGQLDAMGVVLMALVNLCPDPRGLAAQLEKLREANLRMTNPMAIPEVVLEATSALVSIYRAPRAGDP